MVFVRRSADQEVLVLHHLGKEGLELPIPEGFGSPIYASDGATVKKGMMYLPANSSLVLKK
jgi:hypothetical protein